MRRALLATISVAALALGGNAFAQSRSSLITQNNNTITANGRGAITGPVLNSMLFNVIEGSANQSDNNTFTGSNTATGPWTFSGAVTLPSGAAAANIGPLGGALSGTLPNPVLAAPTKTYNVSGSNLATTGSILVNSATLTAASARDFVVGQGIRVNHAGSAFALNQPTGGAVTVNGTTGSTTYQYEIAALDANGGVGAAAASFQTTTGNAALTATNFNYLSWTASSGTAPTGYAVYKSIGGTYTLIGITPDTTFYDYGFLSYTALDWVPATAPNSALADWLVTTISSQIGATFSLATNAITTATSQAVNHDDTAQLQAYFNSTFSSTLPVGRYFVSSQINVPAYVQITGAAQYQTVVTGVQIDNYILNLTYGDNVSNITFQTPTRTAAMGVNSANSVNINNVTCQGGSTGGHESTCFVGYSADSINLTNLYLEGWSGITSGQATGGGPPEINVETGVNDNLSNVTSFNTNNTPIPNQWVVWFDSCFNCTIVNGDFNNNQTYDSSNTDGVRMTNGSQADILTGNQILGYSDGVRMDSQTSGGLLTLDMEGNHLDFCVEACVYLNQGSWVTIVGNSFAGEGTTISNNYGIYFGSAFVNGPNTIVGNTMDGFNGGSAASISLVPGLTSTVVSDNVFTHANLPAIANASAVGSGTDIHDNPGSGGGYSLPHVLNNAALQAVVPTTGAVEVRDGQTIAGDGGQASYAVQSGNCPTPDNGAQVQSNTSGWCWYVAASASLDLRVWPVYPNITYQDSGPGIRAAAAYSAAKSVKISIPPNNFYVNSVDPTGLGGIVAGASPLTTTSASASTGAVTITVANATGISIGSSIGVQITGADAQNVVVTGVSGNVLTIPALVGNVASGANVWLYGAGGVADRTFSFDGKPVINQNGCGSSSPYIKLGPGLNRPLLYVEPQVANPYARGVCWDGGKGNQTGWAGGPNGKLYAVEVAPSGSGLLESSISMDYSLISGGYNGGLYLGAARGVLTMFFDAVIGFGQTTTDCGIALAGYDATFFNTSIGQSGATAWCFGQGSSYTIIGGATYENWTGMTIFGGDVVYLNVDNMLFQANYCGAVVDNSIAPTGPYLGHGLSNDTFDGNSVTSSGACHEINANGGSQLTVTAPKFGNSTGSSATSADYAVFQSGTGHVKVVNATIGANAFTTAFTNAPNDILGYNNDGIPNVDQTYTIATGPNQLPTNAPAGGHANVSDAVSCSTRFGSLTGGGSTWCPVIYNGSAWVQQ